MRRLLVGLLGIIVILVTLVLIAPVMIDVNDYKAEIQDQVRQRTGRDLSIGGEVTFALLPTVRFELTDLTLSGLDQDSAPLARVDALSVAFQVVPLILRQELVVDRFVLSGPDIVLERTAEGQANWVFDALSEAAPETQTVPKATETAASAPEQKPQTTEPTEPSGVGMSLRLGDVRVIDGRIRYRDDVMGLSEDFSDMTLDLELSDLNAPLQVSGVLDWRGETLAVEADVTTLQSLRTGGGADLRFDLVSAPVTFGYQGTVTGLSAPAFDGDLSLSASSLKALLDWMEIPFNRPRDDILEKLSLAGAVVATAETVQLRDARLVLDALAFGGNVSADWSGSVPAVSADLDAGLLDIAPYLSSADQGSKNSVSPAVAPDVGSWTGEQTAPVPDDEGWSQAVFDLSALRRLSAQVRLTATGVNADPITLGAVALGLDLRGGQLTVRLDQLDLYGGAAQGRFVLDGASAVPAVAVDLGLIDIQLSPVLSALSGFHRLDGQFSANLSATTRGASQHDMIAALQGGGDLQLRDGAVIGVNLDEVMNNFSLDVLTQALDDSKKTQVSEISARFSLRDGVLGNDDLRVVAPRLRASGEGTLSLVQKTIDYRLLPRILSSEQGDDGLGLPIVIQGSWSDPQIGPDLEGLARGAVEHPKKIIEKLATDGAGAVKDVIDKLAKPDDLNRALNKLFGN